MIVKLYEDNPNIKTIDTVVEALRNGSIVIYPTDTVYAMGCDIYQARAVEQICKYKGIDPQKAKFTVICDDISRASEYAKIDNDTFRLMKENLPGPFTFILKGSSHLPKVLKNRKNVGIRVPNNNIIRTIIRELGNPILSTSLKDIETMSEYETDPELMEERYNKIADIVIDGGYGDTIASTIVDCTGDEIEITRQGKEELKY